MCSPLNPDCERCPLAGDCLAYAEGKLVHDGKPVQYDIEDSDGPTPSISMLVMNFLLINRDLWPMPTV